MSAALHVYHRRLLPGSGDSLAKIAERIPEGATILDVGTGTGALGEYLRANRACTLDGLNYNAEELELARPHYREARIGDLERVVPSELFPGARYDRIVFADVLEHVRDPARVLRDARGMLAPGGRVLISLPNIGYVGVVASLLAGEFNYTAEGILDDTHVRFFTRASLSAMLARCGFKPVAWDAVVKPLSDTEFRNRQPDAFAPALARALVGHPDALVYQFLVEAADERSDAPHAESAELPPPELAFVVQLFFAHPDEEFSEARSQKALAWIGRLRQRVMLPIDLEGPLKLRLDPADRRGTMKLLDLRIVDAEGGVVWAWSGRPDELESAAGLVIAPNGFGRRGVTLGLVADDPSIVLSLGDTSVPRGARLECEIDWPMSPDTLALSQVLVEKLGREADAPLADELRAGRARESELEERVRQLEATLARERELRGGPSEPRASHEPSRDSLYTRLFRKPRT